MAEPVVMPASAVAVATAGAGGLFLGMPVEAVVLGAISSAAVLMHGGKKSIALVMSHTIIGGLLGGALAPVLAEFFIHQFSKQYDFFTHTEVSLLHVTLPVLVGLCWQFLVSVIHSLYPSIEKRFDDVIDFFFSFFTRGKK